jgi:hypothetical protein
VSPVRDELGFYIPEGDILYVFNCYPNSLLSYIDPNCNRMNVGLIYLISHSLLPVQFDIT